ncbi:MAG: tyrosine-type recombinase/integrase [Acidimicrobiales bacterium]
MPTRRHFGSVRKLPSGRYQASYWHLAERHAAPHTFTAKSEAQTWLSSIETSIHKGEWFDPADGHMTVGELADRWKERDPSKRSSTVARDEAILRVHVIPVLGTRSVHDVTPSDIQRLVNAWAQHQAARTVVRQYAVVRALFAYATRARWVARTPCDAIKLPRPQYNERRVPTPEEVAAIAHAVAEPYRTMVWLGAVLGLRWGELAGLTVDCLDLLKGTITVSRQLTRDGQLAAPKSIAGVRRMTIPAPLVDLLAEHMSATGLTGADRGVLLFRASNGQPLHYSNWRRRVWGPAVGSASLEGVVFHDLRRVAASEMVALGIDVKTAQNRLGHSSVRMTLDVYAKAVPTADHVAAEQLGRRFFGRTGNAAPTQHARQRTAEP